MEAEDTEHKQPRAFLFVPTDMVEAHDAQGAMCGHGALAAALSIQVSEAVTLLGKSGWINVPQMKSAIKRAGRTCRKVSDLAGAKRGVILVQFTGRWTAPGVPVVAACQHRHWVAVRRNFLWDSNLPDRWQTQAEWSAFARRELVYEGVTGWGPQGSYMIEPD